MKHILSLIVLVVLSFLNITQAQANDSDKLKTIVTDYTEARKRLDPYWAHYFNVEEDLDKFGDYSSPAYFQRAKALYKKGLAQLKDVDAQKLSGADKITYLLFKQDMEVSLKKFDFPSELLEFNQMINRLLTYKDDSSESLTYFPFDSVKHYDAYLKRAEGFPAYVDHQIALFRRGIKENIVLSCVITKAVPNTYKEALEPEVEKNPFWRPVLFMPKDFPVADRERLTAGFRQMITQQILPGYKKFDAFFKKEYQPQCRQSYGLGGLKNGRAWYNHEILVNSNLKLDAKTVHETGLREVARIAAEMEKIKTSLGFKGTLKKFLTTQVKDQDNYFKKSEDMFRTFETVKAQVDALIPRYFSLKPESDYKLVESSNPEDAAASYRMPTESMSYGRFVINTKNLQAVQNFTVNTLSLHEAVPGHHFQLAIQFEKKKELTEYQRKIYESNAFVEGWALYAEYLGNEMGLFKDPRQRFGNLNDEMLRAVRLVVDTGIHAFGWSQKQVTDYMAKYLANDAKDIENEANRYSTWPGQALGYKLGQLKIIELRKRAEKALGPKFDIRKFHEIVIGNGTISLSVLESQVNEWIAGKG